MDIFPIRQSSPSPTVGRKSVSKVVNDCKDALACAKESLEIHIQWIKGHADFTGNEAADALAKAGNKQASLMLGPEPAAAIPVVAAKRMIHQAHLRWWQ